MRRYWLFSAGLAVAFLAVFAAAAAMGVPVDDARPWMGRGGPAAALVGVALLTADVVLPVPSSGVMLLNGLLFGVWVGAALSVVGSTGCAAVGFWMGRAGSPWVRRLVTPAEHERASRMLERWGVLAIVATRPVPVLAETVSILAGASRLRWSTAMLASFAGTLPAALAYAVAGSAAASLKVGALVFGGVVLLGAGFWLAGRRRARVAAALLLAAAPWAPARAGAQETHPPAPADSARGLAPMVVTAERSRTPLAATSAAVSVVTGAELRRAPVRTLADALQRVPGLAFLDLDGLGLNPVPTVRGFYGGGEAEYVVLLVDGKPLGALQTGVAPWALVPVSAVERIEVVRGGASSLFGDAALGGVVNVVTRGEGMRGARWDVSGGGLGSWRGSGSVAGARGSVFGDAQRTDGFRDHAGRTAAVAGGALPFAVGRGTVTVSTLATWRDSEEPGTLTAEAVAGSRTQSSPFFRFDRTRDRLNRLAAEASAPFGASATVTGYLAGEVRRTDGVRTSLLAPDFADGQAREVDALRLLGSAQAEVPGFLTPRGRLVAGTDFSAGSVRSAYRPVAAGDAAAFAAASGARGEVSARGRGTRNAAAAFARYELAPVDAVRLSLGGRMDWLRDSFDPSIPDTAASLRARHTAFSPRAGVNVRFVRTARQEGHAYLAAGRSFKAPTPDQLFDQRAIPVPFPPFAITTSNPLLRPQHGTSVEAGLYHRASPGGGVATDVSLAAYRMEMRDELDFDIQSFRYVNLGRSRHRGIEASARVGGAPASLFAAYTLQDVTSATGENAGRALKAIPRHFLAVGVDAGRGDGPAAALSASRAWGIWLDDADTRPLPGFTRVDGRLSWPVRRVRVTLDAFNLLDRKYSTTGFLDPAGTGTAYYFPAAGRTLQLGVGSSF